MSIAVEEKVSWDERISALAPAHQKLLGDLVDEFAKIDGAQSPQPAQYSKEWYIAEVQKGIDDMEAGRVVPFEQVKAEIYAELGI